MATNIEALPPATGIGPTARSHKSSAGEMRMAKGQLRSNKEAKKPKQPKPKAGTPVSPFSSTQAKPGGPGKKK